VLQQPSNEWVAANRGRCKMDLGWEMGFIVEFVLWMGLLVQWWLFQGQMWGVLHGFRHQSNSFLEGVIAFAAGLPLSVVVNCHHSSRRHFKGVD
jgi:hypothetical protein